MLIPEFLPSVLHVHEENTGCSAGDHDRALLRFIDEKLSAGAEDIHETTILRTERLLLARVLQHTGGNQKEAAKLLGITRGSLRNKIRENGITISRTVGGRKKPMTKPKVA